MDGSTLSIADAFDAVGALYDARTPSEAAEVVSRTLAESIRADRIAVYLYDIDEDLMRRVAGRPDDGSEPTFSLSDDALGRAFLAATVVARHEAYGDEEALLVRTVSAHGRVRGAILLARTVSAFHDAEASLADYVADRFAESLAALT